MRLDPHPNRERWLDFGFSVVWIVAIVAELSVYVVVGVCVVGWSLPTATVFALVLYMLVRFCIVMFSHLLAMRLGSSRPPEHKLSIRQWLVLVFVEFLSLLSLMLVLVPFEALMRPRNLAREHDVPILFVHGYGCNAGYWWPTIRYLSRRGIRGIETINLGPGFLTIERYAMQLTNRIEAICDSSRAAQVILVAHSMGGLVSRQSLTHSGVGEKVKQLITVATPHQGTIVAGFSPTPDARQMRPASEFLQRLAEAPQASGSSVSMVALLSFDDNVVIPQSNAELSGACIHRVAGVGHLSMSFSPRIQNWLLRQLQTSQASH